MDRSLLVIQLLNYLCYSLACNEITNYICGFSRNLQSYEFSYLYQLMKC